MLSRSEQEFHARALLPDALLYAQRYLRHSTGDPQSAALEGLAMGLLTYRAGRGASVRTWVLGRVWHQLQRDARDSSHLDRRTWEWYSTRMEERPPEALTPLSLDHPAPSGTDCWHDAVGVVDSCARLEWESLLRTLPGREGEVLSLRYFEGLSQPETGRRLGCSQMHVSRMERRALTRLRAALARLGER